MNAKQSVRHQMSQEFKSAAAHIKSALSDSLTHAVELAQEKGASSWLTSLTLDEFGFSLTNEAFKMLSL